MTRLRKGLTLFLWLLALALAVLALWQLPFADMLSRLEQLSIGDWLLWSLINAVILYLAVKRWQVLAHALKARLSLADLFCMRQAGSAVSFLTPGPHFGGEALQLYWLHKHRRLPLHRAVAVLGLDRFVETGTNIAILLAGVLTLFGTAILPVDAWVQVCAILTAVLAVMGISAALILRHPTWLARRFRALSGSWRHREQPDRPEQGWVALVDLLHHTLSERRPQLWLALSLALVGWAVLLLELVVLLRFLGLSPTPSGVVLIMVGMRLAMLLPMPGGIGTIEASLLGSFRLLGLPIAAAGGLIALIRMRDALVLLVGLGCLVSFQRPVVLPPPRDSLEDMDSLQVRAD